MIGGTVHGSTDAVVPLTVRGPQGQEEHLDFRLDTGFDGDLSLHSAVVAALGLPRFGAQQVDLADGSVILCEVCDGVVQW